jgi:DNA processing protein
MNLLDEKINELSSMKKYPNEIYYDGNLDLLKRKKISIVGSRKPTKYSRENIFKISSSLSNAGVCIVSGGAMGIDAVAHDGASSSNTIAVLPCSTDIIYPAVNKNLLKSIKQNGLVLSQFKAPFRATPWSFVVRNELVVALGDVLVVGEADADSGTMRSVEFALKMNKPIYVLPQRIGESQGTNNLVKENKAHVIYDIDEFVKHISGKEKQENFKDDFLQYCKTNPNYDEAITKYAQKVFEAELMGSIFIKNSKIYLS